MKYCLALIDTRLSGQISESYIIKLRCLGFRIRKVTKKWEFYEVLQPFPTFEFKKIECLDCLLRMSFYNSIEITDEREIILDLRY